jgi:hypothetical protein
VKPRDTETEKHPEDGVAAPAWAKALLVTAPFLLALLLFLAFQYLRG